jgi:hypothetical protein
MRYLWRFASPSTLLFALLLFPLPWVEIQCPSKQSPPAGSIQAKLPPWMVEPFYQKHDRLMTQSGLQAIYGGWRHSDPKWPQNPKEVNAANALRAAMPGAPLMTMWPGLLLGGIVAGCTMHLGRWRVIVTSTCAATALSVAVCQRAAGFPLEHAYRSCIVEEEMQEAQKTGKPPPTPEEINEAMKELTRYTAWFWLAQYAVALCLAMSAAEWWWLRKQCHEAAAREDIRCLDPPKQPIAVATT